MLLAYSGFTESASDVKDISTNIDSKNNIHTAKFTANYGKGIQYVNYYATVKDKYMYCIVLIGDTNSKDKLDKLFNEVVSSVSLENNDQASAGIDLTKYEIIKMMDGRLKKYNYPTFSKATKNESTVNIEGLGEVTYEVYTLTNGMHFAFYSDIKTDELLQLVYVVDREKLSISAYKLLGFVNASLPYLLEKDTYEELDKNLGLGSDKISIETEAAGEERQYYFLRDNNLSALYIYPVGKEILVRAAEASPSPSPSPSPSAEPETSPVPTSSSKQQAQPSKSEQRSITPKPYIPSNSSQQQTQPSITPKSSIQVTPPPSIPNPTLKDNPTFTGGLGKIGKDLSKQTISEFRSTDFIYFAGYLSGTYHSYDLLIKCYYPNGKSDSNTVNTDGKIDNITYAADKMGLGSGRLTVTLVSTGEILATYNFSIVK
jgi:CCR4-NOT transcriptional regulation complex, NOT5 subunit